MLACRPSARKYTDEETEVRRPTLIESSWQIVKLELGGGGQPEKVDIVIDSIQETFSMRTQTFFLICAISEGFILTDLKV